MAGGVALNCVANGRCCARRVFEGSGSSRPPGDAGGALGAALSASHQMLRRAAQASAAARDAHERQLPRAGVRAARGGGVPRPARSYRTSTSRTPTSARTSSPRRWPTGKVVGFFSGRMEFGPRVARRALDPRRSARRRHAEHDESQDQVPRVASGRSRRRCSRSTLRTTSSSRTRARTCCSSRR